MGPAPVDLPRPALQRPRARDHRLRHQALSAGCHRSRTGRPLATPAPRRRRGLRWADGDVPPLASALVGQAAAAAPGAGVRAPTPLRRAGRCSSSPGDMDRRSPRHGQDDAGGYLPAGLGDALHLVADRCRRSRPRHLRSFPGAGGGARGAAPAAARSAAQHRRPARLSGLPATVVQATGGGDGPVLGLGAGQRTRAGRGLGGARRPGGRAGRDARARAPVLPQPRAATRRLCPRRGGPADGLARRAPASFQRGRIATPGGAARPRLERRRAAAGHRRLGCGDDPAAGHACRTRP